MKINNKNKISPSKKSIHKSSLDSKHPDIHQNQNIRDSYLWNDQLIEFHLNDEEPESVDAKRKLEQFSVQLQNQILIDPNRKNQNTINLLKKNQKTLQSYQSAGWVDQELKTNQKNEQTKKSKKNRILSATHRSIRQNSKFKGHSQKKYSMNGFTSSNKKLNLSFNNITPFQMQTIHQNQFPKQIIKKVKSLHGHRPITASCYGSSQKIFNLFDKQCENKLNGEALRIHSTKQNEQQQIKIPITFKTKNTFLKTFSFNSNLNKVQNKDIDKINNISTLKNINVSLNQTQTNENRTKTKFNDKIRISHERTYSEPNQLSLQRTRCQQIQNNGTISQRKNILKSQKRQILNKKIKNNYQIFSKDSQNQFSQTKLLTNRQKGQFSLNQNDQVRNLSHDNNYNKNQIEVAPTSNNLQGDFSLLIKMLKSESQNVFGGQLHNYITQMKNNSLYSYYYSGGINRKKNGKQSLNSSSRLNKTQLKQKQQNDKIKHNNLNAQITKNNTSLHYTAFSSSKHKQKDNQLLRTSTNSFTTN